MIAIVTGQRMVISAACLGTLVVALFLSGCTSAKSTGIGEIVVTEWRPSDFLPVMNTCECVVKTENWRDVDLIVRKGNTVHVKTSLSNVVKRLKAFRLSKGDVVCVIVVPSESVPGLGHPSHYGFAMEMTERLEKLGVTKVHYVFSRWGLYWEFVPRRSKWQLPIQNEI